MNKNFLIVLQRLINELKTFVEMTKQIFFGNIGNLMGTTKQLNPFNGNLVSIHSPWMYLLVKVEICKTWDGNGHESTVRMWVTSWLLSDSLSVAAVTFPEKCYRSTGQFQYAWKWCWQIMATGKKLTKEKSFFNFINTNRSTIKIFTR